MNLVWTYVLGPVLAFLPARWRGLWPGRVQWESAGTVSGILEMAAAIVALGQWYMYEMTRRIGEIGDLAGAGKLSGGIEEQQVKGAALMLLYMSPVTWFVFYFFVEGAVRMCAAAFTERVYGSLPLFAAERAWRAMVNPGESHVSETVRENAKSIAESVRERVMVAKLEDSGDEVWFGEEGAESVLEIRASRRKEEWDPPKVVRVDEEYYRLEELVVTREKRPFVYRLRKLGAGVMGRKVLVYRTK